MALFTDGPPVSIDELSAHDSQLAAVANVENIDVTQKLALAWEELGVELYSLLNTFGAADQLFWQPPRPNLGAVVVTTPLKLWHTYRSLAMVYDDAYNSQLNDRYAGRRDRYAERARWAYERLMEAGIGMASLPLARAAIPTVTAVAAAGAPLTDGTYYVSTAWVNRNEEEGASSEAANVVTAGGTFAAQPGTPPANATGWNVYVGRDPGVLWIQNGAAIAVQQSWTQPGAILTGERAPGAGQTPSFLKMIPRVLQRG